MALAALANRQLAKNAERASPPAGRLLELDGALVHYVERGNGEALILLHGNGSMIADFQCSGLVDLAAERYRVIAFDRPGFGHSTRPRGNIWGPQAQANLIRRALDRIGVSQAIVLGHSWGASVAVALALRHPETVRGLVLASGYYYPTARADAVLALPGALPVIGDLMSHTVAPLTGRAVATGTGKDVRPETGSRQVSRLP